MKATVLLADSAQADANGKVHALGLGWSTTTTPTPPASIIILLEIGWDETNKKVRLHAELVNADGAKVTMPGPLGEQAIQFDAETEAGRAPGIPAGTPVIVPMAINLGPGLNLVGGQRYEWRVTINDESSVDWTASFLVIDHPPQQH